MARILLVEDDTSVAAFMVAALEMWRHEVTRVDAAEAGEEALEREAFELLLTDCHLPGMSGLELIRRLRERGSRMPTLMVTGSATPEQAAAAGADALLGKPVSLEELGDTIQRLLPVPV